MEHLSNMLNSVVNSVTGETETEYEQTFRKSTSLVLRRHESSKLRSSYPNRIPVILEPHKSVKIDKKKYLVPFDITIGKFLLLIRHRILIEKGAALLIFTEDDNLPRLTDTMNSIYWNMKNTDGFLYVRLMVDNATFGGTLVLEP
jgi:GABA(A) receptor-associated protein